MSTECLYIFVNQDPITDPYGWIQNLCARTGYELGPVGSSVTAGILSYKSRSADT